MKIQLLIVFFLIICTNIRAQEVWQKYYSLHEIAPGGEVSGFDFVHSIIADSSGINLITNSSCGNNTTNCAGFVRMGYEAGDVLLERAYIDSTDIPAMIPGILDNFIKLEDGNFLMAGNVFREGALAPYLIKMDSQGDEIWFKTYEDRSVLEKEYVRSVTELEDGSLLLYTNGSDRDGYHWKIRISKITVEGELIWSENYDFEGHLIDPFNGNLIALSSGDLIACFSGRGIGVSTRFTWLAKFDGNGELIWLRRYWKEDLVNKLPFVKPCLDNNIVVGSSLDSFPQNINHSHYGSVVAKIDTSGEVIWEYIFQSQHLRWFLGMDVFSNGDIVVTGLIKAFDIFPATAAWLARLSSEGELVWDRSYSVDYLPEGGFSLELGDVDECPDGSIVAGGIVDTEPEENVYAREAWIIKLDSMGCFYPDDCTQYNFIITDIDDIQIFENKMEVYPNPADEVVHINLPDIGDKWQVSVYNSLGQKTIKQTILNENSSDIDIHHLEEGIYYLVFTSEKKQAFFTKKVIIQKN